MAKCNICNKDMLKVDGCIFFPIIIKRRKYKPIKYGKEIEYYGADKRNCHDCNCKKGHYHHSGCDVERCPRCGKQLITCNCLENEK